MQVQPRDALHVVHADRVHAFAVRLKLIEIQSVEHRVQDLQRDLARRFNRQRETAGQIRLRIPQLAFADAIAQQFPHFVNHQTQRLAGRLRPRVRLRDDVPRLGEGVHVGRRAVREAALGPQHAVQPVGSFAAEDFGREVERHEIVVLPRDPDVADADLRLHGAGPIDDDESARRRRRIGRLRHLRARRSPFAERAFGPAERLVRLHVADDGEDRIVRAEPLAVERDQVVASDRGDGFGRA